VDGHGQPALPADNKILRTKWKTVDATADSRFAGKSAGYLGDDRAYRVKVALTRSESTAYQIQMIAPTILGTSAELGRG